VVAFRAKFNSYIDIQSGEMLGRVEASERVCECNQLKRCAHPFIYSFIQSFILNRSLVSQSVRQPRQSFSQLRDSLFPLSHTNFHFHFQCQCQATSTSTSSSTSTSTSTSTDAKSGSICCRPGGAVFSIDGSIYASHLEKITMVI